MHEERDSPRTVFHCVSCCWNVGWISSKIASCAVKRTPAGKGSERKYLMKSDCWDHCTGRAGETEPEGKPIKNRRKVLKEVRPLYLVNHRGPVATRMLKTKKLSLGINVAENNPDWTGLPVADGGESFHGSKKHSSLPPARRRRLKSCNSSLYHSFLLPNDGNGISSISTFS